MATILQQNLFLWQEVEGSSDLYRLQLALAVMLAMAVGFISQKRPELMRSLVGSTRRLRVAA